MNKFLEQSLRNGSERNKSYNKTFKNRKKLKESLSFLLSIGKIEAVVKNLPMATKNQHSQKKKKKKKKKEKKH